MRSILERRFPAGSRLVTQRLAEEFGVSPTPVREALVELAGIGMVDLAQNCGAAVREFGPAQLDELNHLRILLESEAARCAAAKIDRGELLRLEGELMALARYAPRDAEWRALVRAADSRMHELIASSCGNGRLANEIGRYATLFRTLREVQDSRNAAKPNYNRVVEHEDDLTIVRALVARNGAAAAEAMNRHLNSGNLRLRAVLFPS